MKLYAYCTPDVPKHEGYLKIGETHGNVETRVKQQGHEHNVTNEIVWSDVVISDRIGIDKIIHRYLKEQGFHVQQFDATGKDTEWVKCTVGDIIKAFAVIKQRLYDEEKQREEVGHQFYLEIRNWFYWVTQENERIDGDYALRLVVRLLFCFFLREKNELVPKELLDSNILKNLKSNEEYSYSNGILRNLFFHCLNTPQGGRKYENEKLLIDKKTIKEWFSTIPFLNGGLFNELDKDDIPVGNDYFFSEKKVRLLTELGEKCDVYGLITIFQNINTNSPWMTCLTRRNTAKPLTRNSSAKCLNHFCRVLMRTVKRIAAKSRVVSIRRVKLSITWSTRRWMHIWKIITTYFNAKSSIPLAEVVRFLVRR